MNRDGLLFAGQRRDSAVPAWQMPQGGIDKGEDPETAALRELWEETGVTEDQVTLVDRTEDWVTYDLPPELLGKVWGGKYRGQKQKWFLFRLEAPDSAIRIDTAHPEFSAWRWIGAADLLAQIVPFKRDVYAEVLAAFRRHLA
jgi:putative (di)nucleoside polyphosphate hydrolase